MRSASASPSPGSPRPGAAWIALLVIAAAAALLCADRLMNRSYPQPTALGEAADLPNYFYPAVVYLRSLLAGGELPLWNPYQMAGVPFLAVHQPGATYPLLVGFLWLPPNLALAAHAVFHVFLAGALTFLYARRIGMETSGALAAGLAYMFSWVVLVAVFNTAYLSEYVWLPAILWGVYEVTETRSSRGVCMLALATALAFSSGYSQGFFYSMQLAAAYAVALLPGARRRATVAALLVLALFLGAAASALQLAATVELAGRAVRSLHGLTLQEAGLGVTTETLVAGLFGRAGVTTVSALMIPAAIAGLLSRRTRTHVLFFALAALLTADFMRGSEGYVFPVSFALPAGNIFRLPMRAAFVYAFCGAMLVAGGQTALLAATARLPRVRLVVALLVPAIAGLELYVRSEIPIRYAPITEPESLQPPAWLTAPVNERGQYERLFIERDIPSPVAYKLGQMTRSFVVPDYDPALPAQYRDLFDVPAGVPWHGSLYVTPEAVKYFSAPTIPLRVLDLLSVRFYADARWGRRDRNDLLAAAVGGRAAATASPILLVEREQALPRTFVVHQLSVATGPEEALQRVRAEDFDGRTLAIVTGQPPSTPEPLRPAAWEYTRILAYEANSVEIEARCESRCLLVLTDLYYPGWAAAVDGEPAAILQTDYLLRGVLVPAGVHQIEFSYRPRRLVLAAVLSASTTLILLCVLARATLRRG